MKTINDALCQRRFLGCAAFVVLLAIGMHPAARAAAGRIQKRPVPIRKPLREFNPAALTDFRFYQEVSGVLNPVVETDEFLEWGFVPAAPRQGGQLEIAYFQVYYYTSSGATPNIPHTPEVCYRQGGNQVTDIGDIVIPAPGLAPGVDSVAGKYVRMSHPTERKNRDFVVTYVFCVNGRFYDDREKARLFLAMPWNSAVYFAKIECATRISNPDRMRDALDSCTALLGAAIPELTREHLPTQQDVEAARAAGHTMPHASDPAAHD